MQGRIKISSKKPAYRKYETLLKKRASILLKILGRKGKALDIRISNAAEIRALNKKFLHKKGPTDVLAFDTGDIAICFDAAVTQAKKFNNTILDELSLYLIHGILHLLGYDHKNLKQKAQMEKIQERMLLRCKDVR
ncbi:MAG: rRNA maturation RNase YbeY [Candidatus Omnitrophota bacterium]